MGVIHADVILDRSALSNFSCLESSRVTKVDGNLEIGPSTNLVNVRLSGLELVVGSLALLGVYNPEQSQLVVLDASDLKQVHKFLQIRYTGLTMLNLPSLVMVGRALELKDNPVLQAFDFPLLQQVGLHLVIQDNPVLGQIVLPSLQTIRWELWIQYNTQLETIDTPNLTRIGEDYELHFCGSLRNVHHPKLEFLGEDLEVYSALSLQVFRLPKLRFIGEDLEFDNCPLLETIHLPELVRMDEDMTLSSLPNLKNLEMDSLEEVGEDFEFILVGIPILSLPSLHTIKSDILFTDMANLETIELPNIVIMEGGLEMNGLPILTVLELPVEVIGSNPNTGSTLTRRRRRTATKRSEDKEEQDEAEIDQRFYITGCDKLQKVGFPNLKNITADTMLIFGLPKLKEVLLPNLTSYKVEEDDPDGLELFAIATNPLLDTIVLSEGLNEPKLYNFDNNDIPCPSQGPEWAVTCTAGQLPAMNATDLFIESLCPNDDDHHTESDWERQFCIDYTCPNEAAMVAREVNTHCLSLGEFYDHSNGVINGSVVITSSEITCITCDGVQQVDGCITISNNKHLREIQCSSIEVVDGSIILRNNPNLSKLHIENVNEIGGVGLYIVANAVTEVQFPRLASINTIHIASNPSLTNVDLEINFPVLVDVFEDFEVYYFLSLSRVEFPKLNSTGEDLEIWDLANVRLISLPSFGQVGEDFEVFDCLLLEELSIPALDTVEEDFDVYCNREMTFLKAPNLKHIWEDIIIWE